VIQTGRLQALDIGDHGRVDVECGVWLPRLVKGCVAAGLAGIEALAGIPGTVGGALVTNAGAHGQSIGDVLRQVELFTSGRVTTWPAERVACRYRASNLGPGQLVLGARLQLQPARREDLESAMAEWLERRKSSQPVKGANAGSVFKNPAGDAAWRLIDRAGLRGRAIGAAQVAREHANFIVNRGGASAGEILALIAMVQDEVRTCCGVELETEVKVLGDEPEHPAKG